jgi:hypothetical protein
LAERLSGFFGGASGGTRFDKTRSAPHRADHPSGPFGSGPREREQAQFSREQREATARREGRADVGFHGTHGGKPQDAGHKHKDWEARPHD